MTSETANTPRPTKGGLFDSTFYAAWALDSEGAWQYLPADATPEQWRDRVREGALRCPYPGCDAAYSGVRRGAGRVAFVHPKTGTTHTDKQAKETLWLLAATEAVAQWAKATYPDATVDTADAAVSLKLADGTRYAVVCQYAALSADEWRARHETYAGDSVTDVWLFAHAGAYARKATGTDLLRPPAPLADLIGTDVPAAWLNPFLGLLGTPEQADGGVAARETPLATWHLPVPSASPEATTEAQPEPAAEPEPVAEPEPAAEPEPVAETTPAAEPEPVAEAAPAAEPEPAAESEAVTETEPEAEAVSEPAAEVEVEPEAGAESADAVEDAKPAEAADETEAESAAETPEAPEAEAPEPEAPKAEDKPVAGVLPALRDRQQQLQVWLRKVLGRLRPPAA